MAKPVKLLNLLMLPIVSYNDLIPKNYFLKICKQIVGGMTWCIDSCDVDIDVDLLFQENLTIGQRM